MPILVQSLQIPSRWSMFLDESLLMGVSLWVTDESRMLGVCAPMTQDESRIFYSWVTDPSVTQEFVGRATQTNIFWSSPQSVPNLSFQQHSNVQGTQTALKIGSRNRPESDKNQSQDPKVSFLVLPGVHGSSRGPPPGCQSGGIRFAKRQVWAPQITTNHTKCSQGHQKSPKMGYTNIIIQTVAKSLFL